MQHLKPVTEVFFVAFHLSNVQMFQYTSSSILQMLFKIQKELKFSMSQIKFVFCCP